MANNSKFTYILGAGASANALPIVKSRKGHPGMADAFEKLAKDLWENKLLSPKAKPVAEQICNNLMWLAEGTRKFGTPDTFAKYVALLQPGSLSKLKEALTCFFQIEQFVNLKTDERVLIFLTTLMNRKIFPENVHILNWNYDMQIQIGASIFQEEEVDYQNHVWSKKLPLIDYYPQYGPNLSPQIINNLSMVHLNGIAGYYLAKDNSTILNTKYTKSKLDDINQLLETIIALEFDCHNLLTFAWEAEIGGKSVTSAIRHAKDMVKETEYLVIIGYSFPFFNRNMDKEIFNIINHQPSKLKKIYFQDPVRDGSFLRSQFGIAENIPIEHIIEVDNYFVPMEL